MVVSKQKRQNARRVRVIGFCYVIACALLIAVCSVRFVITSNVGESWRGATLSRMMDGTAERPYAYRVLVPAALHMMDALTPDAAASAIDQSLRDIIITHEGEIIEATRSRDLMRSLMKPEQLYLRAYYIFLTMIALIVYTVILHRLALAVLAENRLAVMTATLTGLLIVWWLPTNVTYIYDPWALTLMTACLYAIATKRWRLYYVCLLLTSLNKESSLFAIVFFAASCRPYFSKALFAQHIVAQLMLWGIIKLMVMALFWQNPGMVLDTQYWREHSEFIARQPLLLSTATLSLTLWVCYGQWQRKSHFLRACAIIITFVAAAHILFGKPGELRVFYETAAPFALLVAWSLAVVIKQDNRPQHHDYSSHKK